MNIFSNIVDKLERKGFRVAMAGITSFLVLLGSYSKKGYFILLGEFKDSNGTISKKELSSCKPEVREFYEFQYFFKRRMNPVESKTHSVVESILRHPIVMCYMTYFHY